MLPRGNYTVANQLLHYKRLNCFVLTFKTQLSMGNVYILRYRYIVLEIGYLSLFIEILLEVSYLKLADFKISSVSGVFSLRESEHENEDT